jgi:hypothetical protein
MAAAHPDRFATTGWPGTTSSVVRSAVAGLVSRACNHSTGWCDWQAFFPGRWKGRLG